MLNGDGMPAFSTTCCPAPLRVYEIHLPPRVGAFQTGSGFGWITTLAPVRLVHSIRPLRSTPLGMGTLGAVFARTANVQALIEEGGVGAGRLLHRRGRGKTGVTSAPDDRRRRQVFARPPPRRLRTGEADAAHGCAVDSPAARGVRARRRQRGTVRRQRRVRGALRFELNFKPEVPRPDRDNAVDNYLRSAVTVRLQ